MRVAIIDEDKGQLELYKDLLEDFSPERFDSILKFEKVFYNQYDIIVLTHRYGDRPWIDIYNDLKSDAYFIITATYPPKDYEDDPDLFYMLTDEISKHKNITFVEKPKNDILYDKIDTRFIRGLSLKLASEVDWY